MGSCEASSLRLAVSDGGMPSCHTWHLLFALAQRTPIREDLSHETSAEWSGNLSRLSYCRPAWPQTSASPMTPSPSTPSATSAPMGSMGSHMRSHRVKARHHATRHGKGRAGSSDNVANQ